MHIYFFSYFIYIYAPTLLENLLIESACAFVDSTISSNLVDPRRCVNAYTFYILNKQKKSFW